MQSATNPRRATTAAGLAIAGLLAMLLPECVLAQPGDADSGMLTRAELTGYQETTGYDEVVQLVGRAAVLSDRVHATSFGTTVEGRALTLVVVGDVPDAGPASVRGADRVRVWLQANIHGGEVCGKEALLMLLRDLVTGAHEEWLSSLVLFIAPIYNADGNERLASDNRPYQLGPIGGTGTRRNAQGLDLNRDHMKLESPEARALVRGLPRLRPARGHRPAHDQRHAAWLPPDLRTPAAPEHAPGDRPAAARRVAARGDRCG